MRVGQSVIYNPVGGERYFGQQLAGIVTKVYRNGRVNVALFDPYGNVIQNPRTNILESELESNSAWDEPIDAAMLTSSGTFPSFPVGDLADASASREANAAKMREAIANTKFQPPVTAATPPGNPPFTDELPPGAKLVENRPATPEEIAGVKAPKHTKKPLKKPARPKKLTNG